MLSRRKLFGFLAAAPVAGAAAAKALAKEPEAPVRTVKPPEPAAVKVGADKYLIRFDADGGMRFEIWD